jgi:hypothetical protein
MNSMQAFQQLHDVFTVTGASQFSQACRSRSVPMEGPMLLWCPIAFLAPNTLRYKSAVSSKGGVWGDHNSPCRPITHRMMHRKDQPT